MNRISGATNAGLAARLASDLWAEQRQYSISGRKNLMDGDFNEDFTYSYYPDSGITPAHWTWQTSETTVIIIRGTRTQVQALEQGNGWSFPGNVVAYLGIASPAAAAAHNIFQHVNNASFRTSNRVFIFGHSYGGEIAVAFYVSYRNEIPDPVPTIITIGAPRVIRRGFGGLFANADLRRYNFLNDPFPRLPFQGDDGLFTQFLAAPLQRGNWNLWGHVGQGCTLNDTGIIDYNELPAYQSSYPQLSLLGLLTEDGGPALIAHSPDTYAEALTTQAMGDGTYGYTPTGSHTTAPSVPQETSHLPASTAQLEAAAVVIENQRVAAQIGIPKERPFRYAKLGSLHCMVCDGQMIIASRFRKTAQSNAKFWNQVWEKWNKAQFGGMPALLAAINKNFVS